MNNQAVIPRRSRRLATIIPASNWISMGYSEEHAQRMVKLQKTGIVMKVLLRLKEVDNSPGIHVFMSYYFLIGQGYLIN